MKRPKRNPKLWKALISKPYSKRRWLKFLHETGWYEYVRDSLMGQPTGERKP